MSKRVSLFVVFACTAALAPLSAWDAGGHRVVNQVALAALPADFPDFVRTAEVAERIGFLSGTPDRWRNVDPWLRQAGGSWTDHFLDVEELPLAGLDPRTVSSYRYNFVLAFAAGRQAHADRFPPIDPAKNTDFTREWPGFAPWAIAERAHRLRSAFGYLKAYEEMGGTPEEIANAKADVVHEMGVLGHTVGDCAQPLHTTLNYNGWVGENPHGYTTSNKIHGWIDSAVSRLGIEPAALAARVPAIEPFGAAVRADGRDPLFVEAMDFLLRQNARVEPLYQLEKAGGFGDAERPATAEGRAFIEQQAIAGGEMLARFWVTAWKTAPADTYLRTQLARRAAAATPPNAVTPSVQ